MDNSSRTRVSVSVLGAGLFASSVVTPGVIICADKFAPHQMTWLKQFFATHIVAPHRKLFDKLSAGVARAHEEHDQKERAELLSRGEAPPPEIPLTPAQENYKIADGWVTVMSAAAIDLGATTALQKLFDKALGIKTEPFRTASVDLGATMVGLLAMPTVLAGVAENINHTMSRWLRRVTGIDKRRAEDFSVPVTYVGIPGLAGTLAGLLFAHSRNSTPHK